MKFCLVLEKSTNSILPQINLQLFMMKGIQGSYETICIPHGEEHKILKTVEHYDGFNVGFPYKSTIGKHLDILTERSKISGAVNTVVRKGINYVGYNTGFSAFIKAMGYSNLNLGGNVAVMGHGATATTVAMAAAEHGSQVTILTRNVTAGMKLSNMLNAKYPLSKATALPMDSGLKPRTLLVNTLGSGMCEEVERGMLTPEYAQHISGFFDTSLALYQNGIYNAIKNMGIPCTNGLRMMIEQVTASHNIWIGTKYTKEELDEAYANIKFALSIL